jgi:hypothetical protein
VVGPTCQGTDNTGRRYAAVTRRRTRAAFFFSCPIRNAHPLVPDAHHSADAFMSPRLADGGPGRGRSRLSATKKATGSVVSVFVRRRAWTVTLTGPPTGEPLGRGAYKALFPPALSLPSPLVSRSSFLPSSPSLARSPALLDRLHQSSSKDHAVPDTQASHG